MSSGFPHITISVAHSKERPDATGDLNALSVGMGFIQAWIFTTMFGTKAVFSPNNPAAAIPALSDVDASIILNTYVASALIGLLFIGLTNQTFLRFYVGKKALIMATALGCVGTLLVMASCYGGAVPAVLAGILMGSSTSLMITLWGTAYARYEFITIILNSIAAIVIGVVVYLALTCWVLSPFSGVLASLLPIVSSLLLWRLTPIPYYRRQEIPIFHPLDVKKAAFLLRFGIPTLIFGFSLGIMRDVCLMEVLPTATIGGQLMAGAAAFLAVVLVVCAMILARDESHWDMIFRLLVPFIAIAIAFLPHLLGDFALLSRFAVLCGFICFEALMWIFFADLSQEFRLSPIYVFGLGRAFLMIGAVLSMAVVDFPLTNAFSIEFMSPEMAIGIMLALVVAYCMLPRQREMRSITSPLSNKDEQRIYAELQSTIVAQQIARTLAEADAEGASDEEPSEERAEDQQSKTDESVRKGRFHMKCEEIADRYLLSRRETEVMFLLAKGHNAAYIQDKLCISKSTAKTHINHIYRKLDIHTQQELLNMVEEGNEGAVIQSVFIKPRK